MTTEEINAELERCKDPEYVLRNHVMIKASDGTSRRPTEEEVTAAIRSWASMITPELEP